MNLQDDMLDAVIVGGGVAGLSAALVLGRCRRRVVVCDAGAQRNLPARAVHGFLSRDGLGPRELLGRARTDLEVYRETIEMRTGTVVKVTRGPHGFLSTLQSGEHFASRTLLLATGVVDELPEVEGFRQFYGDTIHSCPVCGAYELRGQPLAVLGSGRAAAELALELRLCWSDDVVLCTDGRAWSGDRESQTRLRLEALAVGTRNERILRLEGRGRQLERIVFEDGSTLTRRGLFFSARQRPGSSLAEQLGCRPAGGDPDIATNRDEARTCVPGVYAAGNCSRGAQLVAAAVAEGAEAALAINDALVEEELAEAVRTQSQRPQDRRAGGNRRHPASALF